MHTHALRVLGEVNEMKAKINERHQARLLRRQGLSFREIHAIIGVSKGTLNLWLKDIELTSEQKQRLMDCAITGREKAAFIPVPRALLQTHPAQRQEESHLYGMLSPCRVLVRSLLEAARLAGRTRQIPGDFLT